jgi:hypothetical protein
MQEMADMVALCKVVAEFPESDPHRTTAAKQVLVLGKVANRWKAPKSSVLEERWEMEFELAALHREIEKAAELLGERHLPSLGILEIMLSAVGPR